MDEISKRLRAHVLGVLALVSDEAAQRRYQARVPHVDVPAELFNQWDDVFLPNDPRFQGAFDASELDALRRFDAVVQTVSATTPQQLPPLEAFITTEAWRRLSDAARAALRELKE